jgi:hypothetical protein
MNMDSPTQLDLQNKIAPIRKLGITVAMVNKEKLAIRESSFIF